MRFLSVVLGSAAIVVNLLLALFLLGIGVLASLDGTGADIDILPIEPESTPIALVVAGVLGIVSVALAFKGSRLHRCFLLVWCLVVTLVLLAAGFRPGYRFDGMAKTISVRAYGSSWVRSCSCSAHSCTGRRPGRRSNPPQCVRRRPSLSLRWTCPS